MKRTSLTLWAGAAACAVVLLPCPPAAIAQETVLHSFGKGTDGAYPYAGVVAAGAKLYGTATDGGDTAGAGGTVFLINVTSGKEKVIYSFCSNDNCPDGRYPNASLIDVGGTLYGTTEEGGAYGPGTLFALDAKNHSETVLHSFGNGTDGMYPYASVIDVNGILYGTAETGGANGYGTVFAYNLSSGTESTLYSFCSQASCADGAYPTSNLLNVNGTLYGTTEEGGANCESSGGCGTLFALNPNTGAETVLYSFCSQANCADGVFPEPGVIAAKGTLFGTTFAGGAYGNKGTVFAFNPMTGVETVVHSFGNGTDGQYPAASVIDVKGTLYGTTQYGGTQGKGTVFSLDASTGAETVVYSFCAQQNCSDGEEPYGSVIEMRNTLYGTTYDGGAYGYGVAFSLTP